MKRAVYIVIGLLSLCSSAYAQFYNHDWFIGYGNWTNKGRIVFDSTSYIFSVEQRKMGFIGTQGNICDAQGNFLMSSNGVWIANANNDTMLNGSGLNPGYFVNGWPNGLLITNGNFFVPTPGDTLGYTLFHQTEVDPSLANTNLFFTTVNMMLDGGLGGVNSKNNLITIDSLGWGLNACKHANGQDWWVICMQNYSHKVFKILYSKFGIISLDSQVVSTISPIGGILTQLPINANGNVMAYSMYDNAIDRNSSVVICDFDRCTGLFSNTRIVPVCSGQYIWGMSFSPNGEFLYANTSTYIFQINTNTLTVDTVATYDGFSFPIPSAATTFWAQYLAANGKIYLTSGNGVQHLHEINYPDSAGIACDVQQHAVSLGVWHFRAVPNHPNYNLGPVVGSICDTLSVGLAEPAHDFRFVISPNPVSDGVVKLTYLLPQNKAGVLEVFDLTGQRVYSQQLPPWSTLQFVQLPELSNGLYTCVISSGNEKTAKKLVVMR